MLGTVFISIHPFCRYEHWVLERQSNLIGTETRVKGAGFKRMT